MANTANTAKMEEIVQAGEHETAPKVSHSVFTSSRRDTKPFPDMFRESLPIDELKDQLHVFEWARWSTEEAKVNKIISWIVATPNW